jgi:hypothetical protein
VFPGLFHDAVSGRMSHDTPVTTHSSNTAPTALFLCCFAKDREIRDRCMLSLGGATGYELSALNNGEVK